MGGHTEDIAKGQEATYINNIARGERSTPSLGSNYLS